MPGELSDAVTTHCNGEIHQLAPGGTLTCSSEKKIQLGDKNRKIGSSGRYSIEFFIQ